MEERREELQGLEIENESEEVDLSEEVEIKYSELDVDWEDESIGGNCALTVESVAEGISHAIAHWKVLFFGQMLSLSLAGFGASATHLVNHCSLNAPTFQFGLMYVCLSVHLVCMLWRHGCGEGVKTHSLYRFPLTNMGISAPWWFYLVIAILNVEANFFTVLAFRYTTLTSITVFDSLAIPSAMFASKQLLGSRYYFSHLTGATICFIGVVLNVAIDANQTPDHNKSTNHRILGDVLAISGGILYGVNDTLEELMVKKFSQQEFLAMLGFFGSLVSIAQVLLLEIDEVFKFFNGNASCNTTDSATLLFTFVISIYINYVGRAKFLQLSEAALLNLSLLTADLYAVAFTVLVERIYPQPLFYLALTLIIGGVIVYEIGPSPMVHIETPPQHIPHTTHKKRTSNQTQQQYSLEIPQSQSHQFI